MVQSIQALLEHLRKQEPPEELNQVVNNIQDVVFSLLTKSRETLTNERGNVKDQGLETLDELERANRKLDNAVDTLYRTPTKICKQNVASSAYEIAMVYLINKLVKQTISLLEQQ